MHLIKLGATDSTNAYLKQLLATEDVPDGTVVQAEWQQKGRGQLGREWVSEPGKNLTFSILKRPEDFSINHQFVLSMISSLAVVEVLGRYDVPELSVKWPNDILSGRHKICGILVENVVKGRALKAAVIGIGLNVNQEDFPSALNATSMKLQVGLEISLPSLLEALVQAIEAGLKAFLHGPHDEVRRNYEALLFCKGIPSVFENQEGKRISATITGIDKTGQLCLEHQNGEIRSYQLNEIKLVYG